ncbi:hypothetical protein ROV94_17050 [Stenotrophomonas maltophilia]|uniref:hypothetical protein n=1 Tax=Stenotrophomonas maltophilia TaxID=40324 RepID=UPI002893E90D|nr:hypothetical protein [Stenotrophomonas maltophilia]MDT3432577.1 hypothetical protein [Stenotrophomonas maltophilia]
MASFENVTGDFTTILERAQPTFKTDYMEMSRHTDAATFGRELTERMPLANQVAGIPCPVLVGSGEFDELTPQGGVAAEIFRCGAEWLERVLAGELSEAGRDARHYVQRDGTTSDGSADPRWWLGQVPPAIAELLKSEV